MKNFTALLVLAVLCLSMSEATAQRRRRMAPTSKYSMASAYYAARKYVSIGGSVNAVNYFGDIAPSASIISTDIAFTRLNISAFVNYRIKPRLSLRGSLMWSRLQGDDFNASTADKNDRFRFVRNLHFRNDVKELNVTAIVDWFENKQTFLKRPNIVPYAFAGIGVMAHNPKAKVPVAEGDRWAALQPLGTEGQGRPGYKKTYSLIQVVIPAGLGVRYKVNPRIDIAFEWSFRYTFTDYLDDVSGNYADPGDLGVGTLAYQMADRIQEPIGAYSKKSREAGMRQFLSDDNPSVPPFRPVNGFGEQGNKRGTPNEKDWYTITGFHFNYILPQHGRKSRFR